MNNITPETKRIIEAKARDNYFIRTGNTFAECSRPAEVINFVSGAEYALINPELLKAQGLSCNEWVSDRQPTEKDGDEDGNVLAWTMAIPGYSRPCKFICNWISVHKSQPWIPLPLPPIDKTDK